jgi:hypothetical protein
MLDEEMKPLFPDIRPPAIHTSNKVSDWMDERRMTWTDSPLRRYLTYLYGPGNWRWTWSRTWKDY